MLITNLAKIFAFIEWGYRSNVENSEADVALQMSFLYVKSVEVDGPLPFVVIASTEPGEILTSYWITADGKIQGDEYLAD